MEYKNLLSLIKEDTKKAVEAIRQQYIGREVIDKLILECDDPKSDDDLGRKLRQGQVGNIQKDKILKNGTIVRAVRIPLSFQNYIVDFSTSFEVGDPVSIISSEDNEVAEAIDALWRENRIDASIVEAVEERKGKLQSAILFSIRDIDTSRSFVKSSGINTKKDIKTKVLKNKDGNMIPVFDSTGNMIFFAWEFITVEDGKDVTNMWLYDDRSVFVIVRNKDKYVITDNRPHGFDCIPVAFTSQDEPEWKRSEALIDRYEVSISKLGASNDYAGHPILKLYGEVEGAPGKDEDGKAFRLQQKETHDGKIITSDVDFLTYDNAPEAVKLELEELKHLLFMFSSTVDLSLDNLKGLGQTSGFAIQLMFLAPIIKAKTTNTKINSPFLERIINIMLSGIVTTLKTSLKEQAQKTNFDIGFNSILPSDIKERVDTLASAVNARIMSVDTAVRELGVAEDVQEELDRILNITTEKEDHEEEE